MAATKPNPICNEIKPFIWFFQVFGLQFFSVDGTHNKNNSVKYKVYFLVLLGLVAISCIAQFKIQPQVENGDNAKTAVQKSLEGAAFLGVYLQAFVILIQGYMTTSKNRIVLDNFNKISNLSWSRAYFHIDYSLFRKTYGVKFSGILIFFLIIYALPIFYDVIKKPTDDPQIYRPVYTLIPILLMKFASMKFMFYANLVNFHMKMVENLLRKPQVHVTEIIKILDCFHKQTKMQITRNHDQLMQKVSVAKQMYGIIWETTNLLNDCLGWTILVETIMVCCGLIVSAYQSFLLH